MKYCHQCGHPNEEYAQYCERDGIQLETLDTSHKFDVSNGSFCTGCGQSRENHHIYCSGCGHPALEPAIGVNRVEESLKSVAATGTQVFTQIKHAAKTKRLPQYTNLVKGTFVRPNAKGILQGALLGISFLILTMVVSGLLISLIPNEVRSSMRDVFGSESSTFKLTSMTTVVLLTNLFWSLDVERLLAFGNELDGEALSFLSRYPMILEGKLGNYFFAFGGVFILMLASYVLSRTATNREERTGRFLGLLGMVSFGVFILSLFATDVPFIESKWILTAITTLFAFVLAIGIGTFIAVRMDGVWSAAQQGVRALLAVTILSTVFGVSYFVYQISEINELTERETGYYVDDSFQTVGTAQSLLSNWQLIGHGGKQNVTMQTPIVSLEVGTSSFGSTVPRDIERSVEQLSGNIDDMGYMIEEIVEYGEFPKEGYSSVRTLTTLSPSLLGVVRQGAEASYAQDDLELDRLYNEGIFSWFTILVLLNVLVYAVFASRITGRMAALVAFVAAPFAIYLMWQLFLGGGFTFSVGQRELLDFTIHSTNIGGLAITLIVISVGGAIGWLVQRYVMSRYVNH